MIRLTHVVRIPSGSFLSLQRRSTCTLRVKDSVSVRYGIYHYHTTVMYVAIQDPTHGDDPPIQRSTHPTIQDQSTVTIATDGHRSELRAYFPRSLCCSLHLLLLHSTPLGELCVALHVFYLSTTGHHHYPGYSGAGATFSHPGFECVESKHDSRAGFLHYQNHPSSLPIGQKRLTTFGHHSYHRLFYNLTTSRLSKFFNLWLPFLPSAFLSLDHKPALQERIVTVANLLS